MVALFVGRLVARALFLQVYFGFKILGCCLVKAYPGAAHSSHVVCIPKLNQLVIHHQLNELLL